MTKDEALKMALEALKQIDEAMPFPVAKLAQKVIKEALAQPEFIKHEVENADDWSEWVCPDPKNYLMKCCDCGLVHEAQFGVVRYKSETERDDCDMVDDPNLQAVFRMRRSEEWTPEDIAHRSGGLPMAQPEQEPVAFEKTVCPFCTSEWVTAEQHDRNVDRVEQEPVGWLDSNDKLAEFMHKDLKAEHDKRDSSTPRAFQIPVYTTPPQRKPLSDEEILTYKHMIDWTAEWSYINFARAIEAALRTKNT